MLSADPSTATRALDTLRSIGCLVAIDDFGTGHTTIERLRRYGADHVKIDGALVADLGRGVDDAAERIGALTSMASGIGIDAVAQTLKSINAFEITYNGHVLYSKLKTGTFPEVGSIVEKLRAIMEEEQAAARAASSGGAAAA